MRTVLEPKAYSGSGNAFSRSFLVGEIRDSKILHVFDTQSAARHFADVRKYVKTISGAGESSDVTLISDDAGVFDFACASAGEFVSTYAIFEKKRFSPYLLSKKSLRVSVGDRLTERDFVSKLLSFLYAFAEYSADP